jgi:UDP-N-acetylmuramoyl-L-alanyl-D-glutamate--2,6-diaminopimelate ligase
LRVRLDELLPAHAPGVLEAPSQSVDVSSLAYDSRRVEQGSLFFCVPGHERDGHDFGPVAVAAGAAALVVERPLELGVPEVLVASAREAMARAAVRFNRDPTSQLRVIGITGTNGKTTTAFIVRSLIEADGEGCGLLGTVKSVVGGRESDALRTTPEAIDLQATLREMLDAGDSACAMEVSSHALLLERTAGVRFAAAIFTNLTQDHLDFHGTMEDYFLAKRRLFVSERPGAAGGARGLAEQASSAPAELKVLNVGDGYGRRLAAELPGAITFGVECDADYSARDVHVDAAGSTARLVTPAGEQELQIPMPGAFNLANALGALAAVHRLGGRLDRLIATLAAGVRVPGRFEPVDEGQRFAVLVDYAHTPDSLQNVLRAAREIAPGRVICVFGAGGDRDRGKRPLMGEIGARLADLAIVTSDNPRSEDPEEIVAQVLAGARGASGGAEVEVEVDRRRAIGAAIARAQTGDVVLIAGKGHEQGQELAGGVKVPFDDVTVARECLRALQGVGAGPG